MAAVAAQRAQDTSGTLLPIETQSNAGTGFDRQVVVVGDPSTSGVAPVSSTGGLMVTPHNDNARVPVTLSVAGLAAVTTEAIITLTQWRLGVGTTPTVYTVPAGKVFRLQAIQFGARMTTPSTTVTFASTTFRVRAAATGGATITSPVLHQDSKLAASNVATPNSDLAIPDGFDLPAAYSFCVTHVATAATLSEDVLIVGYEYTP